MAAGDDPTSLEPQSVVAARLANAQVLRRATRPRRSLLFVRKDAAPPAPAKASSGTKASAQIPQQEQHDAGFSGGFPTVTPGRVIQPYHDLASLYEMAEYSSELGQNIAAMVTNTAGFGGRLLPRLSEKESKALDKPTLRAIKQQYVDAYNLFHSGIMGASSGGHSGRMTMRQLQCRKRESLERCANAFWEIICDVLPRADAKGEVVVNEYGAKEHRRTGLRHLPAINIFITERDEKPTRAQMPVIKLELPPGDDPEAEPVRALRMANTEINFRRYVQRIGATEVWFKELGDPRPISRADGRVLTLAEAEKAKPEELARELFHWSIPSDTTVYGRVRWMGNLLTVQGDRAAEEVNFDTLENDAIPAMLFMVSGQNVRLSDETRDALEDFEHMDNRNRARAIVVEAEPFDSAAQTGAAMLDAKPLVSAQMHDAMFVNYQKGNADKIRSSFRQSPVFIGRETTSGKSAVEPARRLTDEQVYEPIRADDDETTNDIILPFFGIIYWCWDSIGPSVTDDQDKIKVMTAMEQTGGMTPRISREMGGDILHEDLGHESMTKTEDFDPDCGLNLQLAGKLAHQRANNVSIGGSGSGGITIRKETDDLRADISELVREVIREELAALRAGGV